MKTRCSELHANKGNEEHEDKLLCARAVHFCEHWDMHFVTFSNVFALPLYIFFFLWNNLFKHEHYKHKIQHKSSLLAVVFHDPLDCAVSILLSVCSSLPSVMSTLPHCLTNVREIILKDVISDHSCGRCRHLDHSSLFWSCSAMCLPPPCFWWAQSQLLSLPVSCQHSTTCFKTSGTPASCSQIFPMVFVPPPPPPPGSLKHLSWKQDYKSL